MSNKSEKRKQIKPSNWDVLRQFVSSCALITLIIKQLNLIMTDIAVSRRLAY